MIYRRATVRIRTGWHANTMHARTYLRAAATCALSPCHVRRSHAITFTCANTRAYARITWGQCHACRSKRACFFVCVCLLRTNIVHRIPGEKTACDRDTRPSIDFVDDCKCHHLKMASSESETNAKVSSCSTASIQNDNAGAPQLPPDCIPQNYCHALTRKCCAMHRLGQLHANK